MLASIFFVIFSLNAIAKNKSADSDIKNDEGVRLGEQQKDKPESCSPKKIPDDGNLCTIEKCIKKKLKVFDVICPDGQKCNTRTGECKGPEKKEPPKPVEETKAPEAPSAVLPEQPTVEAIAPKENTVKYVAPILPLSTQTLATFSFDEPKIMFERKGGTPESGVNGNALHFENDAVVFQNQIVPSGFSELTLEFWIKAEGPSSSTEQGIINYVLPNKMKNPDQKIFKPIFVRLKNGAVKASVLDSDAFFDGACTVTSQNKINDGQWHWITLVWKSAIKMTLFVDGVESDHKIEQACAGPIQGGGRLLLGQVETSADTRPSITLTGGLRASLDEIFLFDRALSKYEIASRFRRP